MRAEPVDKIKIPVRTPLTPHQAPSRIPLRLVGVVSPSVDAAPAAARAAAERSSRQPSSRVREVRPRIALHDFEVLHKATADL